MQIAKFDGGGFVIHKLICHVSKCPCSAWYDKAGKLLDAEYRTAGDAMRPVKRHGPLWDELQRIGGAKAQTI